MLYYTEIGLSPLEVPNEISLCIYISGCQNHCAQCHYPDLRRINYGDVLSRNYSRIIALYLRLATCVCFLGEGRNGCEEQTELSIYASYAHTKGLKTCLYSGRETVIKKWMEAFDYIKIGSYKNQLGSLNNLLTNHQTPL